MDILGYYIVKVFKWKMHSNRIVWLAIKYNIGSNSICLLYNQIASILYSAFIHIFFRTIKDSNYLENHIELMYVFEYINFILINRQWKIRSDYNEFFLKCTNEIKIYKRCDFYKSVFLDSPKFDCDIP